MQLSLDLRNVSKRYSGIPAVDNVSFSACAGEVTGYLGANGSGKSTTMKMITGLIEWNAGDILFAGQSIRDNPIAWKTRVGYVPEEPHLTPTSAAWSISSWWLSFASFPRLESPAPSMVCCTFWRCMPIVMCLYLLIPRACA